VKLHAFMTNPALAGAEFSGPSWATWRIIARLIDGDGHLLDADDAALALKLTGRTVLPTVAPREVYVGAGRRGGKSRFGALVSVWLLAQTYPQLASGETAVVAHVAPDRAQAQIDLEYVAGLVEASDLLKAELVNRTSDALEFRHSTRLEVATASYRTVRGRSLAGTVIDESAFLRADDSALPDQELYRAVKPALMTLKGLLLVISSPHRKMGLLYQAHEKYFGNDAASNLYIHASSLELNPTLDAGVIAEELEADPEGARSEYYAEFRADRSGYLDDALIDATQEKAAPGRRRASFAFVDMSGGRFDAAALGIAHAEDCSPPGTRSPPRLILDVLVHVPSPHEPAAVAASFARTLQDHGLHRVVGDKYAAEWVVSAFAQHGITYEASDLSASEIYVEMLPCFAERRVQLVNDSKLLTELRLLERKPRVGGRGDLVDHPRGAHDDLAIAAVGALWQAQGIRGFNPHVWQALGMDTNEWAVKVENRAPVSHVHVADADADCEHCRDAAMRHGHVHQPLGDSTCPTCRNLWVQL
jgi:hypothetical protein